MTGSIGAEHPNTCFSGGARQLFLQIFTSMVYLCKTAGDKENAVVTRVTRSKTKEQAAKGTADKKEGVDAFLNKRKPKFN